MKTKYTVALSLLTGVAIGGLAVHGLHAQVKPKAYLVTETEVRDPAAIAAYFPKVVAAAKAVGGTVDFIPAGGKVEAVVGEAPKRVGVSEWENADKLRAWIGSAERKALAADREKAQHITRQYIIELPTK